MPPLTECFFDEPLLATSKSINSTRSDSPSSFQRSLDSKDLLLTFAFPPQRQKSVSFNHQVEVVYLPSRYDWTEDERRSRWISSDDYTNFQLDIFNTIYLVRNDPEAIDDVCYSLRGVECKDPIARSRRRQWKREAWDAVFVRQRIQRQTKDETNGYNLAVASNYWHATHTALRSAIYFAAQDEIDANKIRREDNQCGNKGMDFCNPSWINTLYSENTSVSNSINVSSDGNTNDDDEEFGVCDLGENSGFDDSWLRLEF